MNTSWLGSMTNAEIIAIFSAGIAVVVIAFSIWLYYVISHRNKKKLFNSLAHKKDHRISVRDILPIDDQRYLLLIRRDDIEHLLLTGGDSDLVIETFDLTNKNKKSTSNQVESKNPHKIIKDRDTQSISNKDTHQIEQKLDSRVMEALKQNPATKVSYSNKNNGKIIQDEMTQTNYASLSSETSNQEEENSGKQNTSSNYINELSFSNSNPKERNKKDNQSSETAHALEIQKNAHKNFSSDNNSAPQKQNIYSSQNHSFNSDREINSYVNGDEEVIDGKPRANLIPEDNLKNKFSSTQKEETASHSLSQSEASHNGFNEIRKAMEAASRSFSSDQELDTQLNMSKSELDTNIARSNFSPFDLATRLDNTGQEKQDSTKHEYSEENNASSSYVDYNSSSTQSNSLQTNQDYFTNSTTNLRQNQIQDEKNPSNKAVDAYKNAENVNNAEKTIENWAFTASSSPERTRFKSENQQKDIQNSAHRHAGFNFSQNRSSTNFGDIKPPEENDFDKILQDELLRVSGENIKSNGSKR